MEKYLIVEGQVLDGLFVTQDDTLVRSDLFNFLKNDFSEYHLICDIEDEDSFRQAMEENPTWEVLFDKFKTIKYKPSIDINEIISECSNLNHSLFLLNREDNVIKSLTEEYGLIFINEHNLEEYWGKFFEIRSGLHLKVTNDKIIPKNQRLNNWVKMENLICPLNSIILFDKYVLKDKSNQKINDNLLPFLEAILSTCDIKREIDITIITEFDSGKEIPEKHQLITTYLKEKGIENVNLNLVKHHKVFYSKKMDGLHSRFLLTNYFHLKCDDSFNFFKENGSINNDADLHVNFILANKLFPFFCKEMNDIKIYLSKIENDDNNPSDELKLMYYPEKSNALVDNLD